MSLELTQKGFYEYIKNSVLYPAVQLKVGDRVYSPIAKEGTPVPFIVFRIAAAEALTKDSGNSYTIVMMVVYEGNYGECIKLAELVELIYKGSPYEHAGTDIEYDDENNYNMAVLTFSHSE